MPRHLYRKRGLKIMWKLFLSEIFTNTVTETKSPEGTKELDWMPQLTICRFFLCQAAVYLFRVWYNQLRYQNDKSGVGSSNLLNKKRFDEPNRLLSQLKLKR